MASFRSVMMRWFGVRFELRKMVDWLMLVHVGEEVAAFAGANESSKQVVVGENGSLLMVDYRAQSELGEAELGTELGFQLSEGGDVALNTSTVSIGPVVEGKAIGHCKRR